MDFKKATEVYEYVENIKSLERRINMIDEILSRDDLEFEPTYIELSSKENDLKIPIKSKEIWGVLEEIKEYFEGIKKGYVIQLEYL